MAIIEQIKNLVIDSVEDALGVSLDVTKLDTSDIVSLGDQIKQADKYDAFYGSLTNRIAKTRYFSRTYEGKDRKVLRDESEYGAFVRKVYTTAPDYTDNPAYNYDAVTGNFQQLSPYDVVAQVTVEEKIYGGEGTFSIECVQPISQIKTAFTSWEEMGGLIDSTYTTIDNRMKVAEERLIADAVNTGIAATINSGKNTRNLLTEYNTKHPNATLTAAEALESAEFLNFACREIYRTKENMKVMGKVFNAAGYETHTPEDKLVCELLTEFDGAVITVLKANTFHDNLVRLPGYETVPYWQASGATYDFSVCSAIDIQNDKFATNENPTGEIKQGGIVAVLRDEDAVAAYFGNRRSWEVVNPRSDVIVHGEQATKGYAVDTHANLVVFIIEDESEGDNAGE